MWKLYRDRLQPPPGRPKNESYLRTEKQIWDQLEDTDVNIRELQVTHVAAMFFVFFFLYKPSPSNANLGRYSLIG